VEIIYNPIFLEHETGTHPENPARLKACKPPESDIPNGEEYLSLVHDQKHIESIKSASNSGAVIDADTITSKGSYKAAVHAVGAAVIASQNADLALVRPPGHHAYPGLASGFCLFNNIAIAVQKLANQGKKVFVLDFDGHCGDGTEHVFYDSDKVLFFSLHQYPAFPGKGWATDIGSGKGAGYSINVALPPNSGDDLYLKGLNMYLPVAHQFNPDIVAVSAGFDAHQYDPLLQLRLTTGAFYQTGKLLSDQFSNVFAILEGGYNLEWLPRCLFSFLAGINDKVPREKEEPTTSSQSTVEEFEKRLTLLDERLKAYWKFK